MVKQTVITPQQYLDGLPDDRKVAIAKLRDVINKNLPVDFRETMTSGMLCWGVPHEIYPNGYHCDPKQPLPFMSLANQKNFIALYHMGIYADKDLLDWFIAEYPKHSETKLDMGKSCIRFKKPDAIPYELVSGLVAKVSVQQWIETYEKNYIKR